MKKFYSYLIIFLMTISLVALAQPNTKTTAMPAIEPVLNTQGWQSLFDGKNIDDWSFVGLGDFALEDGTLK